MNLLRRPGFCGSQFLRELYLCLHALKFYISSLVLSGSLMDSCIAFIRLVLEMCVALPSASS
jgi:hypothetical protein